jgi:hypothetical protein
MAVAQIGGVPVWPSVGAVNVFNIGRVSIPCRRLRNAVHDKERIRILDIEHGPIAGATPALKVVGLWRHSGREVKDEFDTLVAVTAHQYRLCWDCWFVGFLHRILSRK